jgi:hypothetical protein
MWFSRYITPGDPECTIMQVRRGKEKGVEYEG